MKRGIYASIFIIFSIFILVTGCTVNILVPEVPPTYSPTPSSTFIPTPTVTPYPLHKDITVTIFWIGEEAGQENGFIGNTMSAWDDEWMNHYGGYDDPDHRNGYFPQGFIPKENPFYFALPYNDFKDGIRKPDAYMVVYWAWEKLWGKYESMCKNRWIRIIKGNKVVYGQWEDVGPFGEDDKNYVFGYALPQNLENKRAGLDVSPAIRDYLGLSDIDKIDWQFVREEEVPPGPWKEIITTSQVHWRKPP